MPAIEFASSSLYSHSHNHSTYKKNTNNKKKKKLYIYIYLETTAKRQDKSRNDEFLSTAMLPKRVMTLELAHTRKRSCKRFLLKLHVIKLNACQAFEGMF